MRICLISVFAWGKDGGFGRSARTIGRELARRGAEVWAVVPRREGQHAVEKLDGMTVLSFPPARPWLAAKLFRLAAADVYHSIEPSFGTWLAMRTMPGRKHMVTCRDPRELRDWRTELALPSLNRLQVALNWLYEDSPLVRRAVREADAVYTVGKDLLPEVRRMYRPRVEPRFLPTPVAIPERVAKAARPTVCWVARLDRRKRPRLFLELAREFRDVSFLAVGRSRDRGWEQELRAAYGALPNLEMPGFADPFSSRHLGETLGRSWILVNSAARESLPNAMLEAAAHGCAILSHVDPDGFASRFGYHAHNDDFASGLGHLLDGDRWQERGRRAAAHVSETFGLDRAMDLHVAAYERLVA